MKYLKLFEDFSDFDDEEEEEEEEEEDEILDIFEIYEDPEFGEEQGIDVAFKFHLDKLFNYLSKNGIKGININNIKAKANARAMSDGYLEVTIRIPIGINKDILSKIGNDIERFEQTSSVKFTPTYIKICFEDFTYTKFIPDIDINCDDI